jgi:hypothetical protein
MNNETKQTAVEWLAGELSNHLEMPHKYFIEILEQAKEMEKEQIEGTASYYYHECGNLTPTQYYNETYGGNK